MKPLHIQNRPRQALPHFQLRNVKDISPSTIIKQTIKTGLGIGLPLGYRLLTGKDLSLPGCRQTWAPYAAGTIVFTGISQ